MAIDLDIWRTRIEQARALHGSQYARWREAQDIVEGRHPRGLAVLDAGYTPVNYAKAYLNAVVASIYARNPYWFTKARSKRYIGFARSLETVLNYLREELNLKAVVKRTIVDALISGIGWAEVGYTATFGTLEPEPQNEEGMFRRLLGQFKRPATQGVLNEYVKEVSAYLVRQSNWRVYLAPGYHSVSEMPYLIVDEDIAPEDLAQHPLYKKYFGGNVRPTRQVEASSPLNPGPGMQQGFGGLPQAGRDLRLCRLSHVWDRRGQQRFIWLEGTTDTAGPFEWPYAFEGFAQVPLIFNDLPETDRTANGYPYSDIYFMLPQLKELNLLRTQMAKRRRRTGAIIAVQESAMTDEQANKFQSSDDLTLIRMKGNPKTDIEYSQPSALSPDVYAMNDRIMADLDLLGQLAFLLPTINPKDARTATEANFRSQGAGTIRGEKVDVIEDFMRQIARRLAAVVWEFYPRSKIQEILGEDALPEELWPSLPEDKDERRRVIEQELEFSIESGSTQPLKDKTLKNEQKLRLLNVLGGIAPERIKITSEGLGQLTEDFEMPELQDWMLLDDEAEQQVAMKENELLAKNIPQVVGPNELHQLHEQIHAQAMTQGVQTQAMDQHLLEHRKFREMKVPGKPSQQGDEGATRGAAANPDVQRQGMTDMSDLMTKIGGAMSQRGEQRGGIPNA